MLVRQPVSISGLSEIALFLAVSAVISAGAAVFILIAVLVLVVVLVVVLIVIVIVVFVLVLILVFVVHSITPLNVFWNLRSAFSLTEKRYIIHESSVKHELCGDPVLKLAERAGK